MAAIPAIITFAAYQAAFIFFGLSVSVSFAILFYSQLLFAHVLKRLFKSEEISKELDSQFDMVLFLGNYGGIGFLAVQLVNLCLSYFGVFSYDGKLAGSYLQLLDSLLWVGSLFLIGLIIVNFYFLSWLITARRK
ncbi:MAG: hypothetical protein NTW59_00580 [Candidatus Diapherotrites archaeon]|nr:hypothetical protein [Candidatus Diapherotrites archaeon]